MCRLLLGLTTMCGVLLAGSAGAGVTVDLIWADTGTSTLNPFTLTSRTDCSGFNNKQSADGLCAKVVFTTTEGIYAGGSSIAWDTSSGLTAEFASFPPSFGTAAGAIPVGKSQFFVGFPSPEVTACNTCSPPRILTSQ